MNVFLLLITEETIFFSGSVDDGDDDSPERHGSFLRQRDHPLRHLLSLGRAHRFNPRSHGRTFGFSSHPP